MKVLNTMIYLDGGSQTVFTDEGTFWLDRRIGTETKNRLYTTHKNQGGVLIENMILTDNVLKALSEYRPAEQEDNISAQNK